MITIVLGAILTIISFYVEKVAETSSDLPKLLSQVIFFSMPITSFIGVYFSYKTETFKNFNNKYIVLVTDYKFYVYKKASANSFFLFAINSHFIDFYIMCYN